MDCPHCGQPLHEGHVRLRGGWPLYRLFVSVEWESVDGDRRATTEVVPVSLSPRRARRAQRCYSCDTVVLGPWDGG